MQADLSGMTPLLLELSSHLVTLIGIKPAVSVPVKPLVQLIPPAL